MADNAPASSRPGLFPRPPAINTTTDFIVIVFVCMVAVVLVTLTVAAVIAALIGDSDVKAYFLVLTDLMTTIISALVGFLAGKGSGRAEVFTEMASKEERR